MVAHSWTLAGAALLILLGIVVLAAYLRKGPAREKGADAADSAKTSGAAATDPLKTSGTPTVMTIRRLELAQKFPLEPPENPSLARGKIQTCKTDGETLEPILVTTYGPTGVQAVWQAYPLALEAWRCPKCQNIIYPAFLESEQAMRFLDEGVAAGRAGELDDAEFALRRVIGSWSKFSPARVNLGSVYLDRARQAEKEGARDEAIIGFRKAAIEHLEKALAGEPPPDNQVRFMLGNAYMRVGDSARARVHLQSYLADSTAREPFASEARRLLSE